MDNINLIQDNIFDSIDFTHELTSSDHFKKINVDTYRLRVDHQILELHKIHLDKMKEDMFLEETISPGKYPGFLPVKTALLLLKDQKYLESITRGITDLEDVQQYIHRYEGKEWMNVSNPNENIYGVFAKGALLTSIEETYKNAETIIQRIIQINQTHNLKIVDICAGAGHFSSILWLLAKKEGKRCTVYSMDMDPRSLAVAALNMELKEVPYVIVTSEHVPATLINFDGVILHLSEAKAALSLVKQWLFSVDGIGSDNGTIYIPEETTNQIIDSCIEILNPGGILLLGGLEPNIRINLDFSKMGLLIARLIAPGNEKYREYLMNIPEEDRLTINPRKSKKNEILVDVVTEESAIKTYSYLGLLLSSSRIPDVYAMHELIKLSTALTGLGKQVINPISNSHRYIHSHCKIDVIEKPKNIIKIFKRIVAIKKTAY